MSVKKSDHSLLNEYHNPFGLIDNFCLLISTDLKSIVSASVLCVRSMLSEKSTTLNVSFSFTLKIEGLAVKVSSTLNVSFSGYDSDICVTLHG